MPKIDVITPTYRRPDVLPEFFAMLAAQTWRDFRLVLVNDDPSASIAAQVERLRGDLDVLLLEPGINGKAAAARNLALRASDAPLIALCDDDDLWRPWHLQQLAEALLGSDSDLVYAAVDLVQTRRSAGGRVFGERRTFAFAPDAAFLRRWNIMPISGQLYRRELHRRVGLFDEALPHYCDWDWNLRVVGSGAQVRLSLPVSADIVFDVGGDNQSGDPANMAHELVELIAKHGLGELPSSNYWLMLDRPDVAARIVPQ